MNGDPRYTGVALMLPDVLPPITRATAAKVYNRLVKAFGGVADIPVGVLEARGGRPIVSNYGTRSLGRTCWASSKPTRSHFKGWGRLIHDASHYVFEKRHPSARPHDGGHAQLECQMAHYVMVLDLIERYAPKPSKPAPGAADKLARIETRITLWNAKARRAQVALRKLNKQAKYYRSKINAPL